MKFLTIFLFLTTTAFAETAITRNNDNMNAICKTKADVGFRSYTLKLESEEILNDTREVTLEMSFLKCAEVDNDYKFVASSSDEILHNYIILNDGALGTTNNKLTAVNFYAVDPKGVTLSTLSLGKAPGTFRIFLSFKKEVKKAYLLAELTSNITSPIGSIDGLVQRYGGFVLSFE
jgi:hypothetical protein